MSKVTTVEKAMDLIKDGMTIVVGGFAGVGTPEALMDELVKCARRRKVTWLCLPT